MSVASMLRLFLMIWMVTIISGCIGVDLIHTRTWSSGDISKIDGAKKITEKTEGLKWFGVYFSLIVPIPVMIPYGKESDTKWVKDGKTVYFESLDTTATGYGCMLWECDEKLTWGNLIFEPNAYH